MITPARLGMVPSSRFQTNPTGNPTMGIMGGGAYGPNLTNGDVNGQFPPPDGEAQLFAWISEGVPANDHRADHLRARLTTGADGMAVVTAFTRQDSGMLRLLAESDALILRPPGAPPAAAGEPVRVIRLDALGI